MSRIFTKGWIAWHLFVLLALAGCIWAFTWQLGKAESGIGDWQNWIYAVQWPIFAVMGLWGYVRSIWLAFHPPDADELPLLHHDDPDPGRVIHQVRPKALTTAPHYEEYPVDADPELDAYNEQLRRLNEQPSR